MRRAAARCAAAGLGAARLPPLLGAPAGRAVRHARQVARTAGDKQQQPRQQGQDGAAAQAASGSGAPNPQAAEERSPIAAAAAATVICGAPPPTPTAGPDPRSGEDPAEGPGAAGDMGHTWRIAAGLVAAVMLLAMFSPARPQIVYHRTVATTYPPPQPHAAYPPSGAPPQYSGAPQQPPAQYPQYGAGTLPPGSAETSWSMPELK
eukprot:TRINITY_DN17099_c0_g1_i2.p2 TRINITY_DN17099_c0_g1~~TRINITY_DN17099_c0_g1_i2.p2  ORF type:complete len:237 (+),score=57.99 TRINITY_DN17099_c0_g1_i2:96-713(+)